MSGALAGIRVVDMTSVVMGPSATQVLGDHGADIIKVESPIGDTSRMSPPKKAADMGSSFLKLNRNKRSVKLDLKREEHIEALVNLLKTADVFVYSVRPRAMQRMGLSPENIERINPRLIVVSLVGFGSDGPYAGRPVYEDLIQGLTAMPSLLVRAGSEKPHYVPVSYNDRAVGLYAINAIMIALYHRTQTGEGQFVEVPMFESMAQFVLGDHLVGRAFEPPLGPPGYLRTLTKERRPCKTKDGYICIIVYTDKQWSAFAELIGRPNLLIEDPRFADMGQRIINANACYDLVREAMMSRTTNEWLEILADVDVPAARMHTLESLFDDPHLLATGFFENVDHPTEGKLLNLRGPATWSKTPPQYRKPAPHLGEHTQEVLLELGYSAERIKKLIEE